MESDQRAEWNHGNAVYGIKPQGLYFIRASRDSMRDFVGVPYNARGALIPYQAYGNPQARTLASGNPIAAWITNKELLVDKSSFFVGGDDRI